MKWPDATLRDFTVELAERANAQHAPTVEGVTLASLHAAKGLEWDAVFLVGLNEGMMPIAYADTAAKIEEERRLLYVGVTRAREHLTLSWALSRTPGGRGRNPSRFLDGLRGTGSARPDAFRSPGAGRGPDGTVRPRRKVGPVRCRVCAKALQDAAERKIGRCLDCPSDVDAYLFEQLHQWRLERATEHSQPAFVIFTDATLTAIAEVRPLNERQLAAIPGVSRTKLERFGDDVLALCAGHELAIESDPDEFEGVPEPEIVPDGA